MIANHAIMKTSSPNLYTNTVQAQAVGYWRERAQAFCLVLFRRLGRYIRQSYDVGIVGGSPLPRAAAQYPQCIYHSTPTKSHIRAGEPMRIIKITNTSNKWLKWSCSCRLFE